jgi:hypothetical protein
MLGLGTGITHYNSADAPALETGNYYLELWLKFNTGITESSNDISAWADQSGNNNHALQTTASRQPTLDTNRVKFNVTGDNDERLELESSILLKQFTVIASIEISFKESMGLLGKSSDHTLRFHQGADPDRIDLLLPDTTAEDASMFDLSADIPHRTKFIFSMRRAAGPDDNVVVRFDGTDVTDLTAGARNDSDHVNVFTVDEIGAIDGNLGNWRGYISELAIFSMALSDTDLTRIENEISTRTGV